MKLNNFLGALVAEALDWPGVKAVRVQPNDGMGHIILHLEDNRGYHHAVSETELEYAREPNFLIEDLKEKIALAIEHVE